MIITQTPACRIVAGDILVYDTTVASERETAEVLSSYTYEAGTSITYRNAPGRLETYTYPSDELLNCVDIEAEARALVEEMESLPEYEAMRKGHHGARR